MVMVLLAYRWIARVGSSQHTGGNDWLGDDRIGIRDS
jgi:hypothetical protein